MGPRPEVRAKDPKLSKLCPGQKLQPHSGILCWKLFAWKQIVTLLDESRLWVVGSKMWVVSNLLLELGLLLESGLTCSFVESLDVVQRRGGSSLKQIRFLGTRTNFIALGTEQE